MEINLSYLAGYIDGDGCFFLNKESHPLKYRAAIIISSTNRQVLESFKNEFSGSIYKTQAQKIHWKRSYHWMIRGKYAFEFTKLILDYLTEKKEDAFIFMSYILDPCKLKKEELIIQMRKKREELREIDESVVQRIKNVRKIGIQNHWEYSYLAGFIDAECCLGISKYKPKNRPNFTYKIILQCTNTNPIIFFWLRERFGGSITHVKRKHKNPNHRDQIIWNLSGDALSLILPELYPLLRTKKNVCGKLMELHQTILPNGGDRQSKEFKDSYTSIMLKRDKIVDEIHKLNSKGVVIV